MPVGPRTRRPHLYHTFQDSNDRLRCNIACISDLCVTVMAHNFQMLVSCYISDTSSISMLFWHRKSKVTVVMQGAGPSDVQRFASPLPSHLG